MTTSDVTVRLLPPTIHLAGQKQRMADVRSLLGTTEEAKAIGLDPSKGNPKIFLSLIYPQHLKKVLVRLSSLPAVPSQFSSFIPWSLISPEDHYLRPAYSFDFFDLRSLISLEDHHRCFDHHRRIAHFFLSSLDCRLHIAEVAPQQSPEYFGDEEPFSLEMHKALDKVEQESLQLQTPTRSSKQPAAVPSTQKKKRAPDGLEPELIMSSRLRGAPKPSERAKDAGMTPKSTHTLRQDPGARQPPPSEPPAANVDPILPQAPPMTTSSVDQTHRLSTDPRRSESAGPSQGGLDGLGSHNVVPNAAGQGYYPYGQSGGPHPYSIPSFPPHAHGVFPPAPQSYHPGAHYHHGQMQHLPQQVPGYLPGHPNAAQSVHNQVPPSGYHHPPHAYFPVQSADVARTRISEEPHAPTGTAPSVDMALPPHPATAMTYAGQNSAPAPPTDAPTPSMTDQPVVPMATTAKVGAAQQPMEVAGPPSAPPSNAPIPHPSTASRTQTQPAVKPSRKRPIERPTMGPNAKEDIFSPEYVAPPKSDMSLQAATRDRGSPGSATDMTLEQPGLIPVLPTVSIQPATPSTVLPGVPSKLPAGAHAIHLSPTGDDDMDIDNFSYDQLTDSPTVGRLSSEKAAALKKGLQEVDESLKALSKATGLSVTQIIDRWQLVQFRLPTLWNIYQQYFNENAEDELQRLASEQRPHSGAVPTRGHISAAYKQFKKAHGKALYGQKLKTWYQLHCLTLTDEMTMGQREREFNKFHNKLDNMTRYYSTRWGFETAIVVVGSVVNQDQNLGKIIMTPGAVDCFFERFNMTDDHLLCHVKSHVYDRVSKQLFAEDQAQTMQLPNNLSTATIPSTGHQGPSAQSFGFNKSKSASLAPPTVKAEANVELDLSDPEKHQQLITALRKKFEDLGVEYGLAIIKNTGGGQRLQWKSLLAITSASGYVFLNWPEGVDFPCDTTVNSSSKSVTKGIASLSRKALLSLYEAFIHPTYPLKLEKRYDGQVPEDQPVLIGAPPEAGSCHSHGRRKFLDEQRNEDRQGPPRLSSSKSSKRKAKDHRKPSVQPPKRRKVSRTPAERFIVESDDDDESHASYEPEEEDGDDDGEVHSPKRLRSATAAAPSAGPRENVEEQNDGGDQSDDSDYQEHTDPEDDSEDSDNTDSSPASVKGSARSIARSSTKVAAADKSPRQSSTKLASTPSVHPSVPSPPCQSSSTAVELQAVGSSAPSTPRAPRQSSKDVVPLQSAAVAAASVPRHSPATSTSGHGNQTAAQSNLANQVAQELFGVLNAPTSVSQPPAMARSERQTSEVVDGDRPTPVPPGRQPSEVVDVGRPTPAPPRGQPSEIIDGRRPTPAPPGCQASDAAPSAHPQLHPQYPYVPPGVYGAPGHQAAWHGGPPMQHWPPPPPADHNVHAGGPAAPNPSTTAGAAPSAPFDSTPIPNSAPSFDHANQLSGYPGHPYNHSAGHPYNPPSGLPYNPASGHPGYMYNMPPGQGHYNAMSGPYPGGYPYYHPQPPQPPPASHAVHPAAAAAPGHPAGSGEEKSDAKGL